MFDQSSVIVGLEVGTSKICAVVGEVNSDSSGLSIIGVGQARSRGVRKAEIVDASLDRKSHRRWRGDRWAWYWSIKKRPSVSLMMTYLSVVFLSFWIAALVFAIHRNWP